MYSARLRRCRFASFRLRAAWGFSMASSLLICLRKSNPTDCGYLNIVSACRREGLAVVDEVGDSFGVLYDLVGKVLQTGFITEKLEKLLKLSHLPLSAVSLIRVVNDQVKGGATLSTVVGDRLGVIRLGTTRLRGCRLIEFVPLKWETNLRGVTWVLENYVREFEYHTLIEERIEEAFEQIKYRNMAAATAKLRTVLSLLAYLMKLSHQSCRNGIALLPEELPAGVEEEVL